jgi:O-antigen biosynthesis protein
MMSFHPESIAAQLGRLGRQLLNVSKHEGASGVALRLRSALAARLVAESEVLPVARADVLAADLSCRFDPPIPDLEPGRAPIVNWVTTPPAPRSGGHTTLFRIIRHLASRGYQNRLYFYDVYRSDLRYYEAIVRRHYDFDGHVATVDHGMADAHAVVATAWPTAYPVFNSRCRGLRFYFVQDFEPYFHPCGAASHLAENTYRMGFHGITAGRWLAGKLQTEFGMEADFFDFGSDASRYRLLSDAKRAGVAFYARPGAARRAFELGMIAMELFAARRPDIELHFYGAQIGKRSFPFIDHGSIAPEQLNLVYNRCYAGLSLSMTNASLVPHEMLAAGCIPIVNDADHARLVLDNPFIRYAPPYPAALATALEDVVTASDFDALSRAASASVRATTWEEAGDKVDSIIRKTITARARTKSVDTIPG